MRISNRKELQNIAITHSADIDYNDFMRIYRECTEEPCSFLTTDTTLFLMEQNIFLQEYFKVI